MKKIIVLLLMWHILAVPAFALDGNELLTKIDRNLNPESFEMYRKLLNIEPDGSEKEFIMYSVKKGKDKIASVFCRLPVKRGEVPCV